MSRNFWSSCTRQLDAFPEKSCPLGTSNYGQNPECPWFIKSKDDHYCFWKWLRRKSSNTGYFKPISQQATAKLLDMSLEEVKDTLNSAITKIQNLEIIQELRQLHHND